MLNALDIATEGFLSGEPAAIAVLGFYDFVAQAYDTGVYNAILVGLYYVQPPSWTLRVKSPDPVEIWLPAPPELD